MNKIKSCPHCGSATFYKLKVNAGGEPGSLLPIGLFHGPYYENIICGQCGHVDWFVSTEHLALVRGKLEPLP